MRIVFKEYRERMIYLECSDQEAKALDKDMLGLLRKVDTHVSTYALRVYEDVRWGKALEFLQEKIDNGQKRIQGSSRARRSRKGSAKGKNGGNKGTRRV